MADHGKQLVDAVHAYIAALNAADLDAIVALYAPDGTVEDPVGSEPKVGHAAIRAFYAGSVAMGLEVALEGEVRVVGRTCVFPFSVGLTYEGRRTVIRPIDVFDFDAGGRIQHMRAYFGPANVHH